MDQQTEQLQPVSTSQPTTTPPPIFGSQSAPSVPLPQYPKAPAPVPPPVFQPAPVMPKPMPAEESAAPSMAIAILVAIVFMAVGYYFGYQLYLRFQ